MQSLLQKYRGELISQSRLLESRRFRMIRGHQPGSEPIDIPEQFPIRLCYRSPRLTRKNPLPGSQFVPQRRFPRGSTENPAALAEHRLRERSCLACAGAHRGGCPADAPTLGGAPALIETGRAGWSGIVIAPSARWASSQHTASPRCRDWERKRASASATSGKRFVRSSPGRL